MLFPVARMRWHQVLRSNPSSLAVFAAIRRAPRTQSSRLAEFGGRGMSFNICRGTLGSLAMLTAIRNASSRDNLFIDVCRRG